MDNHGGRWWNMPLWSVRFSKRSRHAQRWGSVWRPCEWWRRGLNTCSVQKARLDPLCRRWWWQCRWCHIFHWWCRWWGRRRYTQWLGWDWGSWRRSNDRTKFPRHCRNVWRRRWRRNRRREWWGWHWSRRIWKQRPDRFGAAQSRSWGLRSSFERRRRGGRRRSVFSPDGACWHVFVV